MKVMHVITGLRVGGAENQLVHLVRHSSNDACVVALTNADEVAGVLRADGVPVFDIGMRSNRNVAAVHRLAQLMRRERPDVVHVHLYRATVYGRLAARLADVPVVVTTEHSLLDGVIEGRRIIPNVRRLYLSSEKQNHATIAVSEDVAERLRKWGVAAEKIHVVPNGIDPCELAFDHEGRVRVRRELGIPDGGALIGGVGRLHTSKKWDLLIEALRRDLGPKRQLLIAGAGEDEARLRNKVSFLGLTPWVHLGRARTDLTAVLSAMDVVVSPSPQETFGLAAVEAVAAGRRVVYVASPAVEALGPLPNVTRVDPEEWQIRNATLAALRLSPEPAPVPDLARFDVRATAKQVDGVYDACWESVRRSRAAEGARTPADGRDVTPGSPALTPPVGYVPASRRLGKAALKPRVLVLLPVLGALLGALVAAVSPAQYSAHAYVLIASTGGTGDVTAGDIAQATARVATSESVLSAGSKGPRLVAASRDDRLTASTSPDAPLVDLAATGSSPRDAATLADAFAQAVEDHVSGIGGDVQVRADVFAAASEPTKPASPNALVDIVAGGALGVVLAAVGFALRRREGDSTGHG